MRIERLRQNYHVDLRWVHFPLHPETPREGQTLEQLFAGRDIDIAGTQVRMKELMAAEGLPYGERTMTYNSRMAQELAAWAAKKASGEAIHDALFRAYFVDNINLAGVDNLLEIAAAIGLDEVACREALTTRRFRSAVSADWERSRQAGVTGVPTFIAGAREVVGAQPYEMLERLVSEAGAGRRPVRS